MELKTKLQEMRSERRAAWAHRRRRRRRRRTEKRKTNRKPWKIRGR
jgi:hypothetical protein